MMYEERYPDEMEEQTRVGFNTGDVMGSEQVFQIMPLDVREAIPRKSTDFRLVASYRQERHSMGYWRQGQCHVLTPSRPAYGEVSAVQVPRAQEAKSNTDRQ